MPACPSLVLLTGVYALCLLLVTHGRLGTATILMWWPAALIALSPRGLPGAADLRSVFTQWVAGLTLLTACLPALAVVATMIRDPRSYR